MLQNASCFISSYCYAYLGLHCTLRLSLGEPIVFIGNYVLPNFCQGTSSIPRSKVVIISGRAEACGESFVPPAYILRLRRIAIVVDVKGYQTTLRDLGEFADLLFAR